MLDQASRLADGLLAWEYHRGGSPPWVQEKGRVSKKLTTACRTKVLTLMRAIRGALFLRWVVGSSEEEGPYLRRVCG
jgi:hypothetical protein